MWISYYIILYYIVSQRLEMHGSHKAETAPLFGTGSLSLVDKNEEQDAENPNKTTTYGATDNKDTPSDEEDADAFTEVTADFSSSASPTKKKSKKGVAELSSGQKPGMPRRDCLLSVFQFMESFGVLTSLSLMATQILPIILIPFNEIGVMSLVLKVYVSVFCLLFILVEWDLPILFLRNAQFLQAYLSRGFLYSFLGLSCLEEAYSERVKEMVAHSRDQFHVAWFSLFMQVSSWMMLGLGIPYMLLGVCCWVYFDVVASIVFVFVAPS
jgi:hypothetical protein